MATIGMQYPVYSIITKEEFGKSPTYGEGGVIGKGILADKTINTNNNPLYADGAITENDRGFSDGTIKFTVDDIDLKTKADLLGLKYTQAEEGGLEGIKLGGGDVAPYVGVGYYKTKRRNNVTYYEATWFFKVQFAPFSDSAKTKEKAIDWQTADVEGTIMTVEGYDNDVYEETVRCATDTEAKEWLNTRANITTTTTQG